MRAYIDSIAKSVSTVMVSYSSWNGVKMHANRGLVTGVLKKKLGFKGFVISHWQGIDQITSPPDANYTYSDQASIDSGLGMVMVPYHYPGFISDPTTLVHDKIVPMKRINDAVRRILPVQFVMGLFKNPLPDNSSVGKKGAQRIGKGG